MWILIMLTVLLSVTVTLTMKKAWKDNISLPCDFIEDDENKI